MAYQWKDKVVLITGAATGIGAVVVRIIMDEGVKHVAVLDIAEKPGIALQDELNAKYGPNRVKFMKCDVTNDEQLLGSFQAVKDEQGCLDVVINNAGIMNDSLETYKKEIEINVTALITGTLKAIELMGKDKGGNGGTVINIASIAALFQSPPLFPIYSATKSAVLQFSNSIGMNEYYSRTGVRVLAMCFGATDTPLLHMNNLGSFDKDMEATFPVTVREFPHQKVESAAQGLVEAYKHGKSGSTWLATTDRPVLDISASVEKAYGIMAVHVFE